MYDDDFEAMAAEFGLQDEAPTYNQRYMDQGGGYSDPFYETVPGVYIPFLHVPVYRVSQTFDLGHSSPSPRYYNHVQPLTYQPSQRAAVPSFAAQRGPSSSYGVPQAHYTNTQVQGWTVERR